MQRRVRVVDTRRRGLRFLAFDHELHGQLVIGYRFAKRGELLPHLWPKLTGQRRVHAKNAARALALDGASEPDDGFLPYAITNETGVPLRYGRAHAGSPSGLVIPGATEACALPTPDTTDSSAS